MTREFPIKIEAELAEELIDHAEGALKVSLANAWGSSIFLDRDIYLSSGLYTAIVTTGSKSLKSLLEDTLEEDRRFVTFTSANETQEYFIKEGNLWYKYPSMEAIDRSSEQSDYLDRVLNYLEEHGSHTL